MSVFSMSSSPSRATRELEVKPMPERKSVSVDMKIENRLNMKDLEQLQEAFMADGDGYENRLSLTKPQFCEALALLLKKGTREEYAELFDKIDVTREDFVDWDKFASHMLLEFYEKDDRVKSTQVPQWKDIKLLPSPHKEIIVRIGYLKNTNRYISISKEGCVSMWGQNLKLQRTLKASTESCKARDLWVTHFVALQNINKIALSFTCKEIAIYDLSAKLEFNCQYKVQGLTHTPLCLDYWFVQGYVHIITGVKPAGLPEKLHLNCDWYNPENPNEAILVWGDVGGFVNSLHFNSANIALFERPPAPAKDKQDPCLNVQLADIARGMDKNAQYTRYQAHTEWVRQVSYSQYLECFISCATTWTSSVFIGWMERHGSVNQNIRRTTKKPNKNIQRSSKFQISQGVNAFAFNDHLNLIATAGVNHHVCLWNPYVVSKPSGVLRGHMAGVIQVHFIKNRGQLISFSKDKVLRIWDVQLQVCIQRLAGMFPKGPEVTSVLYFDEGRERGFPDINRLFITFNYQLSLIEIKVDIRDRIMSHEKPVVAALYNSVFNQVISVCQAGTIIVWLVDSGQKVKQFSNTHGHSEVTCLTQDHTQTRLYTGSTDGTVKVWDFNGHCFHTLNCTGGQPADVGQILILKRSVVVIGWTRYVTVFQNGNFRQFHVEPADWKGGQEHAEDILCTTFMGPNTLVTGSYDGEIVIWNTNSEHASRHLDLRARRKFLKSRMTTFATSREPTHASEGGFDSFKYENPRPPTRPKSRATSRVSEGSHDEQNEYGWAVTTLLFLETRKGNSAGLGANLVSCGGNGWVRFWNTAKSAMQAEFVGHMHAGSIIMTTDKQNQYLVTGDVDGYVKVWSILDYCLKFNDDFITTPPMLMSQFQPHQDMLNSLEICERNDRLIIISASSDCSVALWDVYGNKIGVFGQEQHWKIEPYVPGDEISVDDLSEDEDAVSEVDEVIEPEEDSHWEPDDGAVTEPGTFRINTWDKTVLGRDYQELRVQKRERRQPHIIPNLPYLHWERTGHPPAGPYAALTTSDLEEVHNLVKPDAEKYFIHGVSGIETVTKLPLLSDTLKSAFDEKSLFPKYIIDFETKMKSYHQIALNPPQVRKTHHSTVPGLTAPTLSQQKGNVSPTKKQAKIVRLKPLIHASSKASMLKEGE